MVVIAIVLILLLIAVPAFTDLIDRARVRGAAGAAISTLAQARGSSVQTNRDVVVTFAGSDPDWCIGAKKADEPAAGSAFDPTLDAACDCTAANVCMVGNQELRVTSNDYNGVTMGTRPANVIYDGRLGVVQALTPASVVFTSPKGKYKIRLDVAALGQASMCTPAGQPIIPGILSC